MKNLFFILVLSLTSICQLGAQTLEVPEITSVSVDTISGKPVVKWKLQHPELVDGYIVKRLIVDGNGVISGTYNNIAIIDNNNIFSYIDISNAYSTKATPNTRQEYYRVSAFKNDAQGQTHYSLMSQEASTMKLSGEFDYCTNSFNFSFSPYCNQDEVETYYLKTGFPNSKKLLVTKDTVCSFSFSDFVPIRDFAIETVLKNGSKAISNIIKIKAQETILPDKLQFSNITVDNDNHLEIKINLTPNSSTSRLLLTRRTLENDSLQTFDIDFSSNEIVFKDISADVSKLYAYKLLALNDCNVAIKISDSAANIVLNVKELEGSNSNFLQWNNNIFWKPSSIEKTEIYRSIDDSEFQYDNFVTGYYSDYEDFLSNIIADKNLYEGKFCYYIKMYQQTNSTDTIFLKSNIACIEKETIIYIPNAINPKSDNYENREFKPKADFLQDYKMTIFSKRGEIIFETTEISKGWDGYNRQGNLCQKDTYAFIITYKTAQGKKSVKKGYVNLVY